MAILNNNPLVGASGNQGGYNINNSLRFRSSASAFLNRTPASAGNRRTWTWSAWVKTSLDCSFMYAKNGNYGTKIYFNDNKFGIFDWQAAVAIYWEVASSAVFRDPSAWYHLVVAVDTTQATASNRVKLYVNGNQITALATSNYPTQNYDGIMNTANPTFIGKQSTTIYGEQSFYDGYMAEVNFIDGQALTPSSFGETDTITGVWKPKAYSGTYGTNGFYLKFSDIATTSGSNAGLGRDFSGNSNYWTTNNISVTAGTTYDAMTDSPINTSATVSNFCVVNPLKNRSPSLLATYSEGNLKIAFSSSSSNTLGYGTMAATSGKWYWEATILAVGGSVIIGIADPNSPDGFPSASRDYSNSGNKDTGGSGSSYGASYTTNDVIGVALDIDNGTIVFYKNGVSQGTAFTDILSALPAGGWTPFAGGTVSASVAMNFGQRPFAYTPPTGFVRLNTYNLPTPTILQGNTVMDATLWTGTGSGITITNAGGFKPDLVWYKQRNGTRNHLLFNSVSGTTKYLQSNTTVAEQTDAQSLTSFNSNGFTLGTNGNGATNGETYVGWQWQAGQGTNTTNTAGSITSTVSVNTTAGFSIVTYTGIGSSPKTVGHGLGVAPKMILLKNRSSAVNWYVWHTSLGATQVIEGLNTTAAAGAQITFNNTLPTSSVISLGNNDSNNNGTNYVLYVWAEIAGFSKFTSYTGNGSADGVFVYLGFRPKFVMVKRTDVANDWNILNSSQQTYNQVETYLLANLSNAEGSSGNSTDFLSNGFKLRTANAWGNASGGTYIVAAWAENPFKNSLAR